MKEKKCIKCNNIKSLDQYYRHIQMSDGHLNKCKECTKLDSLKRYNTIISDPEHLEKERKRHRLKYHRLHDKWNKSNKDHREKWNKKFPEKIKAKNICRKVPMDDGYQRHHWSYNKEHLINVIKVKSSEHKFYHRFLNYDQKQMMYRTICEFDGFPAGLLLDSKEIHIMYMQFCKVNFER